jgi:hypothetical protein
MHIQSDRAFVPAGTPATRYLAVTISAPPAPASDGDSSAQLRAGVDVAFVLDRSGSMAGRKIELARQAVAHAIRLLKPEDRLALVVYDEEVNVLVEMTAATPQARAQALAALATVEARGATDLSEGWFTGARGLGAAIEGSDRVRRVLLLTDGLANRGETDAAALTQAARDLRAQGIGTSTFGLGVDFDETLLTALAAEGGGHFYFLEHPQQIPDAFASELGEVLDVVARDAVFEVVAGPGTEVTLLNSLPVEQQGDVLRVRLGDLVADQELSLVVAIRVGPRAEGEGAFVACRVHDRDGVMPSMPMQVDWTAVSAEDDREQPVNHAVVQQAARMLAEAARLQALDANRHGHFTQARDAIHAAVERIERLDPDDAAVQRVAAELRMEEDAFVQRMAPLEAKARRYVLYQMAYSRPEGKSRRRS